MPRRLGAAVVLAMAIAVSGAIAQAESPTGLLGGLTAPAAVTPGPNRLPNGGFEAGVAPWSGGRGWSLDRHVSHTGTVSYRREDRSPTATTTVELAPGIYRFSAWVKTEDLAEGLRLRVDLRPGTPRWLTAEIARGTADWRRYELTDVVVDEPSTVTLRLETDERTAGTAWFDDIRLEEQLPAALHTFLLYPNFRGVMFDDGPSSLRFDLQVTPPAGHVHRYSVRGLLRDEASGEVVTARSYAARAAFVAELDGSSMRPGMSYRATFALIDDTSGTVLHTSPVYRVWRAAASTRASLPIALDRHNRVLVDGVPRFLLGGDDPRVGRGTPAAGVKVIVVDACAPTAEAAFARYDGARRRDAAAVTLAVAGATELRRWADAADIVGADAQPMFGPEPAGGYDHNMVAEATARSRAAVRDARPVVSVLPFAPLATLGRWPTRAELRSHAYMAVVEGARGLWWSSVGTGGCGADCGDQARHMDDLNAVVDELAALEPVLVADDAPAALAAHSNSNIIKAKVKVVNGKGFVLAYNASGSRQSATFTWSAVPGAVTVHGENRALVATGRSFGDTFAPFAAHVYVIDPAVMGAK
jgi:hypothetical protein